MSLLCNNNTKGKDRVKRMASQETPNYRLSRWAGTDRILVEEFNDNWDKIDTAIKGSEDKAAAALAATTALEQKMGLQHIQTVNGTTGLQHLHIQHRLGSVDGSPFLPDPEAVRQ